MQHRQHRERPVRRMVGLDTEPQQKGNPGGSLFVKVVAEACDLVCYIIQVLLQLREIEALCKTRLLCFGRQYGLRFINAVVPPRPGALLRVPPGKHRYAARVVGHGIDRVAFIQQRAGRPWLMIVELLNAVLLHLESQVHAAKYLHGLLDVRVVLGVDLHVSEDLVGGNRIRSPVVQHIKRGERRIGKKRSRDRSRDGEKTQ